jgi:hypothetical protein
VARPLAALTRWCKQAYSNKMKDRPIIEIVIIMLTALVCVSLLLSVIGTLTAKIVNPQIDVKGASEIIGNNLGVITGALVGFLGGRYYGRSEANGEPK